MITAVRGGFKVVSMTRTGIGRVAELPALLPPLRDRGGPLGRFRPCTRCSGLPSMPTMNFHDVPDERDAVEDAWTSAPLGRWLPASAGADTAETEKSFLAQLQAAADGRLAGGPVPKAPSAEPA